MRTEGIIRARAMALRSPCVVNSTCGSGATAGSMRSLSCSLVPFYDCEQGCLCECVEVIGNR
jgi:hypothetical protein